MPSARIGEPLVTPASGLQRLVSLLFELYGDEWLVIPAMHYRWHRNREWAMRAFGALNAPTASAEEQFAIGQRRAAPFAKAAQALGAQPHMHAAIESSYRALAGYFPDFIHANPADGATFVIERDGIPRYVWPGFGNAREARGKTISAPMKAGQGGRRRSRRPERRARRRCSSAMPATGNCV